MMKKPKWVVEKERGKKAEASETVWVFSSLRWMLVGGWNTQQYCYCFIFGIYTTINPWRDNLLLH